MSGGILKSEFLTCSSLRSNNQCPYDKMEVTTGFRSSNRFRNHLDGLSNGRLKWNYGGTNTCWRNFENRRFQYVSTNGATTSNAMTKRRLPLDSARQIGLRNTPHEFSDSSGDVSRGGEV